MKPSLRFALRWLLVSHAVFALLVLVYIHYFVAPPIAKEMELLVSSFRTGDSLKEVHQKVKERFPNENFLVTLSSEEIGDGIFCFEEWKLTRGYALVVFYSTSSGERNYLSGLVVNGGASSVPDSGFNVDSSRMIPR
jgi:hypothetical protein